MQPLENETIRPYLKRAIQDIDTFLARLQEKEKAESELADLYHRMERGEEIADVGASMPHAFPYGWLQSSALAAACLRDTGTKASIHLANIINAELSKLPTEPPGAAQVQDYRDAMRTAAERFKTILALIAPDAPAAPAEVPEPAAAGSVDLVDGPVAPNSFRYKGKEYSGLAKGPFAVLREIWESSDRCVDIRDLSEILFGDREEDANETTQSNLRKELNKFFRFHNVPYHAIVRGHSIAVKNGNPRAAKTT